jgi:hypothetical protein
LLRVGDKRCGEDASHNAANERSPIDHRVPKCDKWNNEKNYVLRSVESYLLYDGMALGDQSTTAMERNALQLQLALKVAAGCVAAKGTRSTLRVLDAVGPPTGPEADAIREDTRFSVFRRTLA